MLNGSEATCPDRSPWMRRPSPSLGVGPSGDIDVANWGDRIDELAGVEDALRVLHSARPSPDEAPCELTRLTSRQRLILRGLRWFGRRPLGCQRLGVPDFGRSESPAASESIRSQLPPSISSDSGRMSRSIVVANGFSTTKTSRIRPTITKGTMYRKMGVSASL